MAKTARDICYGALRMLAVTSLEQEPDADEFNTAEEEYLTLYESLSEVEGMDFSGFTSDTVPDKLFLYFKQLLAQQLAPTFSKPPPPVPRLGGMIGMRRAMFPDDRGDTLTDDEQDIVSAENRATFY